MTLQKKFSKKHKQAYLVCNSMCVVTTEPANFAVVLHMRTLCSPIARFVYVHTAFWTTVQSKKVNPGGTLKFCIDALQTFRQIWESGVFGK
jgi:hypothetical protein